MASGNGVGDGVPRSSQVAQRRLELVRASVARSVLPPLPSPTLGEVVLAPHQREAAARLVRILARHGGALLADDVGLGKTYVALAVAREYERCTVIAPPALLPMWAAAVRRTHTRNAAMVSLHAFSRGAGPEVKSRARGLVIIDEAHHLRNPSTQRYGRVSAAIAGADVLLLSATPVHNRDDDVRALLALFAGTRPDLLAPERRAELIVRREASMVRSTSMSVAGSRPAVRWHRAHRVPMDRAILERIMALPAPLPAKDGAEAGALIRMGLLRAWCSSEAALLDAVRRRRLRGAVLRDALQVGRHPTQVELQSWATSEGESQLGFAELLAAGPVEHGPLLAVLDRHLAALNALADALRSAGGGDVERAAWLKRVMAAHPGVPVVAFSQYARTVEAMYRALRDIAGVGMLTGARARIASGPIGRQEALQRFAPLAHERPPPPSHEAIRVLLTTDLLAEGVNLQDAGVVVHCDAPWTAALRDQRVGRCVRIGSPWGLVHVYRLAPSTEMERLLRFEARVVRKAAIGARVVGRAGRGRSAVEERSALFAGLAEWDRLDGEVVDAHAGGPRVAVQRVRALPGWRGGSPSVAALIAGGEHGVIRTAWLTDGVWRVCGSDRAALALVSVASAEPVVAARVVRDARRAWLRGVRRAVRRWGERREARAVAGDNPESLSAVQRAALGRLGWAARTLTVTERVRLAPLLAAARRAVVLARSSAAERALRKWVAAPGGTVAVWLARAPVAVERVAPAVGRGPSATEVRVLLLVPSRAE